MLRRNATAKKAPKGAFFVSFVGELVYLLFEVVLGNVGIDHGCGDGGVAEELLDAHNVNAGHDEMGCVGVAKKMKGAGDVQCAEVGGEAMGEVSGAPPFPFGRCEDGLGVVREGFENLNKGLGDGYGSCFVVLEGMLGLIA